MKNVFLVVLSLPILLVGCGGDNNKGSDGSSLHIDPPLVINHQFEMLFDERGCLIESSAEAETRVNVGDKELKFFLWNCTTGKISNLSSLSKVEVYLEYNAHNGCYIKTDDEALFDFDFPARFSAPQCGSLAEPINHPEYAADIVNFSVEKVVHEDDLASFRVSYKIKNIGNIPIFFFKYSYKVEWISGPGLQISKKQEVLFDEHYYLLPNQEISNTDLDHNWYMGRFVRNSVYRITYTISDYYGVEFDRVEQDVYL